MISVNNSLSGGNNNLLSLDRYNRTSSSLYLNSGRLIAPNGYYIYEDFTLSFWVNIQFSYPNSAFLAIGDLGNATSFGIINLQPYYFNQNDGFKQSNMSLNINQWQHLAYTMQETTISIYIDGQPVYKDTATRINYEQQSKVFFGGWINNPNALFDDIRIFNTSLNQAEIISCS